MRRWTTWVVAAGCTALTAAGSFGLADTAGRGDAAHGKAITKGAPAIAPEHACSSCHGDTGEGKAEGGIPRLAGQSQPYLLRALDEYAEGVRESDVMRPIAKALKQGQRDDVTAYYASLKESEWTKPPDAAADTLRRGEALAAIGSAELGVQGCMNCHGPQGRGLPPSVPYLAGQSADYLADRLKAWRTGKKGDSADPANIMAQIASHLGEEDIMAVAAYFAQLPPEPIRLGAADAEKAP